MLTFQDVLKLFYAVLLFEYLSNIFRHVYLRRQKFSFQTYTERKIGAENRCRFPAPENGVDLWRRFLERMSGLTFEQIQISTQLVVFCPTPRPAGCFITHCLLFLSATFVFQLSTVSCGTSLQKLLALVTFASNFQMCHRLYNGRLWGLD